MTTQTRLILLLHLMVSGNLAAAPFDADEDGLRDAVETGTGIYVSPENTGSRANLADSDGDSLPDGMEVRIGTNPNDAASKVSRPNIILINCDDLGYGDLGCFWQNQRTGTRKFSTPELDRMAAEGAMMTHHYVGAPICAPSRASLLQGRHQGHSDIRDRMFDVALPDNHSVAALLRSSGYHTVHVGKAGLAGNEGSGYPAHPLRRGFNRFFGYLSHFEAHEHYPKNGTTTAKAFIRDDYQKVTAAYQDLYTPDAWTGFAKKTIIEQTTTQPQRPFFLYVAYDTPHFVGQTPPTRDYPAGRGVDGGIQWTGAPSYVNTAVNDPARVDSLANMHPSVDSTWPLVNRKYVTMIRRLDDSIADLLQTLRDLGIDRNTLVILTSDNGPDSQEVDPRFFQSYAGFEGMKQNMQEGGIRVPTIVWWPGKIPATGNLSDIRRIPNPSANYDWLATFAEMAMAPVPAYTDGTSLLPDLTGIGTRNSKDYLYFEFWTGGVTASYSDWPNHGGRINEQMQAIRVGDYMGLRTNVTTGTSPFRIYDVVRDPKQSVDLAAKLPELQDKMKYLSLAARRPIGWATVDSAYRPYDATPVPALTARPVRNGVYWKSYEGIWPWLPEFRHLTPVGNGVVTSPDLSVRSRNADFGVVFEGYLKVATTGNHTFQLSADAECGLWINEAHVIDNDYNFLTSRTSAPIVLSAGLHSFRMVYRHQAGSPSLQLRWSGPGFSMQAVPETAFCIDGSPTVIGPDAFITNRNQSARIEPLANDSAQVPILLDSASSPMFGSAVVTRPNDIDYHPGQNFIGLDKFNYRANDGVGLKTGLVEGVVLFDNEIWFPLDEGQGTVARQKGGGGTALPSNGATANPIWVSGQAGRALRFAGSGDRLVFSGIEWPTGAAARTFSCWLRTTNSDPAVSQTIFSQGSDDAGARFTVRLMPLADNNAHSVVGLEIGGATCGGAFRVNDGHWHHLAVVVSDQNSDGKLDIGDVRMFVNGLEDARYLGGDATQGIYTNEGAAMLGGSAHAVGHGFVGDLDDIRMFERGLAPEEVTLLRSTLPRSPDYPSPSLSRVRDLDGDGIADDSEYIAGTDPEDPNSRPFIRLSRKEDVGLQLGWRAVAGRTYRIEESDDLSYWRPTALFEAIDAGASDRDISLSLSRGRERARFYRLRIELTKP